jgi:hypothetical protein
MGRRATATVGLTALAAAIVLVVAMTTVWRAPTAAGPAPEPTHDATTSASVDPAQLAAEARAQARLARKAKAAAAMAKLFADNGCWEGEAPADVTPTHALVTLPGELPTLVSADVGYGIWLDGDAGQLHGFCP